MQVEHEVRVVADELADFIHEKDDAVILASTVEVFFDPFGEGVDGQADRVLRLVEPGFGGCEALAQSFGERFYHLVFLEVERVTLLDPVLAAEFRVCGTKLLEFALAGQVAFHLRQMRILAAEPLHLVKHTPEHREDGSAPVLSIGTAVDIKKDDIGISVCRAFDISEKQGVLDFTLEELRGPSAFRSLGVTGFPVVQQVGQDLDEVRLARPEEAGDPDAHSVGKAWIMSVASSGLIGVKELAEMLVEFLGENILFQFLPYDGIFLLFGFDDAVDGAEQIFCEQILDQHSGFSVTRKLDEEREKMRDSSCSQAACQRGASSGRNIVPDRRGPEACPPCMRAGN